MVSRLLTVQSRNARRSRLGLAIAAICLSLSLQTAGAVAAPVQWLVEDGGNGNYFEVVVTPNSITRQQAQAEAALRVFNGRIGSLASAHSAAKDLFIRELAAGTPDAFTVITFQGNDLSGPWIGANQPAGSAEPDGGWTWIDGEAWNYANWLEGEPNQGGGTTYDEDSIHLFQRAGDIVVSEIAWNDLTGHDPYFPVHSYVVEYLVPEPASIALVMLGGAAIVARRRR